jgi:AcrR family transcriptional regulator
MELKEKQRKILDVAVELFKEKGYGKFCKRFG